MKKIILLSTVLVLIFSFTNYKKNFLPPGTVKINDTLFADQCEVSNFSWLEYQLWVCNKYGHNSPEYRSCLADTTVWRETGSYNEPYVHYYLRHPAYRDYPVVGVSYEQVVEYCKWRTERVKETNGKKHSNVSFEYRLPSKHEWEFLSSGCNKVIENGGRNEKGQVAFNHRWAKDNEEWMKDVERAGASYTSDIFAPVFSYWPNNFKLYNMLGNVAEMVSEKGISKGGSWTNILEECKIAKDIPYSKPSAMVGFRCVCVVKKAKI